MCCSHERTTLKGRRLALLRSLAPALLNPGAELDLVVRTLAQGLATHMRSAEAVPELESFLRSRHVALRRAAASALGKIASKDVVAPLAAALNDTDRDVRYFAVRGLAEATGSDDAPAAHVYEASEAAFLATWRNFAASTR